jgi:hypothetical protein
MSMLLYNKEINNSLRAEVLSIANSSNTTTASLIVHVLVDAMRRVNHGNANR